MAGSVHALTVHPLLLVEAGGQAQLGVVDRLLVPLPVLLAEQRLPVRLVEVDHLVVHEHWHPGFGELGLRHHVAVRVGDDVVDGEFLGVEACSSQGDHPQHFVVGVEVQTGVEELPRVQSGCLSKGDGTPAMLRGRSCL